MLPPEAVKYAREESTTVILLLVAIGLPKSDEASFKLKLLDYPVGTVISVVNVMVLESPFIAIEPTLEFTSALPEV